MTDRDEAEAIQKSTLRELMSKSYAELLARPETVEVEIPKNLSGFSLFVLRRIGSDKAASVEIAVELRKRVLLIFGASISDSFEMLPNGVVITDEFEFSNSEISRGRKIPGLPDDVEDDLLKYLLLELGQNEDDVDCLKISDLRYDGVHVINGRSTHCWKIPWGDENRWGTVTIEDGVQSCGMARLNQT
jgi:hypothetical protein